MHAVLDEHLTYLSDGVRLRQFERAIRSVIKGGEVVADVGCGFGVLGLMCLNAGAARVWGLEKTAAADIAREIIARSELAERFVIRQERSLAALLPERVDLVVCDHIGHFGLDYGILFTLPDAMGRFLKSTGRIIPRRIELWIAAIESSACRSVVNAWASPSVPKDYHWLTEYALNTKHVLPVHETEIVSDPHLLGCVNLEDPQPDFLEFVVELTCKRPAAVNALAGWFNAELADGVWLTNSPLSSDAINRLPAVLPIAGPVQTDPADRIVAKIGFRPNDGLLSWNVRFPRQNRRFAHSTFKSWIMPSSLSRETSNDNVQLTAMARARLEIMRYCDGTRTQAEIEALILEQHADLLPSPMELKRLVSEVIAREATA